MKTLYLYGTCDFYFSEAMADDKPGQLELMQDYATPMVAHISPTKTLEEAKAIANAEYEADGYSDVLPSDCSFDDFSIVETDISPDHAPETIWCFNFYPPDMPEQGPSDVIVIVRAYTLDDNYRTPTGPSTDA